LFENDKRLQKKIKQKQEIISWFSFEFKTKQASRENTARKQEEKTNKQTKLISYSGSFFLFKDVPNTNNNFLFL